MKIEVWDQDTGVHGRVQSPRPGRSKKKTIAQILRAAYRKHVRDNHSRQAVKRYLH